MEGKTARNWYWWLWLSPLATVTTFVVVGDILEEALLWNLFNTSGMRKRVSYSLAILFSSLWHLTLLGAVRHKTSAFVRWHGRQALLVAGVRTAVALGFVLAFGYSNGPELCALPILIVIWLAGMPWGYVQATNGKCTLMRWCGRGDAQPAVVRAKQAAQEAAQEAEAETEADALVEVIRYSHDPQERREALARLQELRMVESL